MVSLFTFVLICLAICATTKVMMVYLTGLMQVGVVRILSLAGFCFKWYAQLPMQIYRVQHTQLFSLPMEILTQILAHLKCVNVVHVRQVFNHIFKPFFSSNTVF